MKAIDQNLRHISDRTNNCIADIFRKLKDDTKIKTNDGNDTYSFSDFIKDDRMSPSFGRIVCVVYDGNVLEYFTFADIISKRI